MKITSILMDPRVKEAFASYHETDFRAIVFSDPGITDPEADYWMAMYAFHGFSKAVKMLLNHRTSGDFNEL